MSDVKFSALPAATTVALTDIVPEVDLTAGTTKKATWATVRAALLPAAISADVSGLGTGVATFLATPTSANLAAAMTDETGSAGKVVFSTSPSLVTPSFSSGSFSYIWSVAAITASRTIALPLLTANDTFVFAAFSQTLTNKTLDGGSNTFTNIPVSTAVGGLGAGVATFLGTPSGANLGTALTSALPVAKGGTGLTALTIPASGLLVGTTDTQTLTGKTLAAASNTITGLTPANDVAASAMAALAIDWSVAAVFTKTLAAGANTITFANQSSGRVITVRLTGAASTVTWPTVKWAGGTAPTQTTSGTDVYTFVHDGTSIYGSVVQAMA